MKDLHILISSYRMVRDLDRATTKICSSYGLTYPQFQVLEALLHKGNLTVGEIRDSILSSNWPFLLSSIILRKREWSHVQRTHLTTDGPSFH